jgi:hypothetical protein
VISKLWYQVWYQELMISYMISYSARFQMLHPRAVPHSRRRRLRWVHPRDVTPICNHWFRRSRAQTGHGATQVEVSTWLSSPQTIPIRPLASQPDLSLPPSYWRPILSTGTPSCSHGAKTSIHSCKQSLIMTSPKSKHRPITPISPPPLCRDPPLLPPASHWSLSIEP